MCAGSITASHTVSWCGGNRPKRGPSTLHLCVCSVCCGTCSLCCVWFWDDEHEVHEFGFVAASPFCLTQGFSSYGNRIAAVGFWISNNVSSHRGSGGCCGTRGCLASSSALTSPKGEQAHFLPSSPFTSSPALGNTKQTEARALGTPHYFSLPPALLFLPRHFGCGCLCLLIFHPLTLRGSSLPASSFLLKALFPGQSCSSPQAFPPSDVWFAVVLETCELERPFANILRGALRD